MSRHICSNCLVLSAPCQPLFNDTSIRSSRDDVPYLMGSVTTIPRLIVLSVIPLAHRYATKRRNFMLEHDRAEPQVIMRTQNIKTPFVPYLYLEWIHNIVNSLRLDVLTSHACCLLRSCVRNNEQHPQAIYFAFVSLLLQLGLYFT